MLPPSLGALTRLIRISLHINQLEHLPPEIGNLVHLEALRHGAATVPCVLSCQCWE